MIPHYEHNDSDNFIAGGYIDEKVCDNLISYFEKCKYNEEGKVGTTPPIDSKSLPTINDDVINNVKKSTDLGIQHILGFHGKFLFLYCILARLSMIYYGILCNHQIIDVNLRK